MRIAKMNDDFSRFKTSAKKVSCFIIAGAALTVACVAAVIGCLAGSLAWASSHIAREGKEEGLLSYLRIAPIDIIKSVGGIGKGSHTESAGEDKDSASSAVDDQGTSGEDCALDTSSEESHHKPTVDPLKEVQELIDSDVREPVTIGDLIKAQMADKS
jgi:hypothetical protein